jgi:hypothetical protein
MARQKKKGSKLSYSGLGMKPEEDEKFIKLLEQEGYTGRQLLRGMARQWMEYIENGGSGLIKYRTK